MRLADLGERICILGPSGGGKSTLAAAIGKRLGVPVIYLDQLRHVAGTQWELRPDDEFAMLHDAAVQGERWVIEGNYSSLLPVRLQRATGLIVVDISMPLSLWRYLLRTLHPSAPRLGGLRGTRDRLSWPMIRWILKSTRANRRRRRELFERSDIPKIMLSGVRVMHEFSRGEGLALTGSPPR